MSNIDYRIAGSHDFEAFVIDRHLGRSLFREGEVPVALISPRCHPSPCRSTPERPRIQIKISKPFFLQV
jgi:hypothetical protein